MLSCRVPSDLRCRKTMLERELSAHSFHTGCDPMRIPFKSHHAAEVITICVWLGYGAGYQRYRTSKIREHKERILPQPQQRPSSV
ncbi:hypothetical protein F2P81_015010 [Scophthalmus maximus]|uniref:Uncharacterized protein n=1 Tax=Scophthalmus maximus TaxID=52904 RepID=A0A6A4SLI5_SCOMX|nr:hypothetical protein F2P81_015010 [Scophthalmus maximus]